MIMPLYLPFIPVSFIFPALELELFSLLPEIVVPRKRIGLNLKLVVKTVCVPLPATTEFWALDKCIGSKLKV